MNIGNVIIDKLIATDKINKENHVIKMRFNMIEIIESEVVESISKTITNRTIDVTVSSLRGISRPNSIKNGFR